MITLLDYIDHNRRHRHMSNFQKLNSQNIYSVKNPWLEPIQAVGIEFVFFLYKIILRNIWCGEFEY